MHHGADSCGRSLLFSNDVVSFFGETKNTRTHETRGMGREEGGAGLFSCVSAASIEG